MRIFNILIVTVFISIFGGIAHASNIMPNYYYDIRITRAPTHADGDFTIRLTSPSMVTGCVEISAPTIDIIDAGAVLYMTLEEGSVGTKEKKRYGQFDCDKSAAPSYAEITLNKNTLKENGTYKIDIKSKEAGRLFDIKVETDENSVTLHTELKTPVTPPNVEKKKILKHWFYPDNTIIVFAHGMDRDPDIRRKAANIAASRGLTPLDTFLDGFSSPTKQLFFVDSKNVLNETLGMDNTVTIGNITASETYMGAGGAYQKEKQQAVFAKRPSIHD